MQSLTAVSNLVLSPPKDTLGMPWFDRLTTGLDQAYGEMQHSRPSS
jgi:hypothetical protein